MGATSRDAILKSIRRSIVFEAGNEDLEQEYASIRRRYEVDGTLELEARTGWFLERLQEFGATTYRCSEPTIAETVRCCLLKRQRTSIIVPAGISEAWLPAGFQFLRDDALAYDTQDKSDGALTGCTLAIASTGSIVVQRTAEYGRSALTLVPDYHLCVVGVSQIVETLPEAIRSLSRDRISSATIISGPSATSDIEMTRIKGVHGPRTLDVIVFG